MPPQSLLLCWPKRCPCSRSRAQPPAARARERPRRRTAKHTENFAPPHVRSTLRGKRIGQDYHSSRISGCDICCTLTNVRVGSTRAVVLVLAKGPLPLRNPPFLVIVGTSHY